MVTKEEIFDKCLGFMQGRIPTEKFRAFLLGVLEEAGEMEAAEKIRTGSYDVLYASAAFALVGMRGDKENGAG